MATPNVPVVQAIVLCPCCPEKIVGESCTSSVVAVIKAKEAVSDHLQKIHGITVKNYFPVLDPNKPLSRPYETEVVYK